MVISGALGAVTVASTAALAGCGSGDSTVAKTPVPRTVVATTTRALPPPPPATSPPPPPPSATVSAAADPCAVNLGAPEITKAATGLPPDPRSGQGWSPEPLAGNYNECAQLSVVIIRANTNAHNPNTRAIMFHEGKFIPTGVPDTFGFNGIDASASTGDTVALKYSNGVSGLDSIVKFRWNGNGVELVANIG
jgi:LppP/LprE lipoprotein